MASMAVRAAALTTPRLPPPPPKPTPKSHHIRLQRSKQLSPPPMSPATLSLLAAPVFSASLVVPEARAFSLPKEEVLSSLTKVEDTIDQVGGVGARVLEATQSAFKVIGDTLKPGVDAVLPLLRGAGEEAVKFASPVVSGASKQATEALQSAGVDPSPVVSAAKTVADVVKQTPKVIEEAKPIASATVETIASSDPSVVVVTAGGLFLAYLLLPSIWSAISFNLRGYKGNLSPAQALDFITAQNHLVIDIRSEKDKSKAGVPRLPSSAKNKIISIPLEEIPSKIKGLIRNTKKVEAEMVALKISYLKRVNGGSNIIIMDSYCDTSKTVARTLTGLGFKNCWVMRDGFSGGKGWLQSRLGTDSYNLPFVEVLSPSRVIPAVSRFATASSSTKLLPGSLEN